jgi:hypothetical protein
MAYDWQKLLELKGSNADLSLVIDHVLKLHPESKPDVGDIALKLEKNPGDRPGDSDEQNDIARHQRTLANLRERRDVLIKLHSDDPRVEGHFKDLL